MDPIKLPTRLVICVDGTWGTPDGRHGSYYGNISTIYRIFASIKEGECRNGDSGAIKQVKLYYPGVGSDNALAWSERLRAGIFGRECLKLIRDIYQECCMLPGHPEDEVWFYGYSRGAYIVRAVAGLLHYLRAIKGPKTDTFQKDYERALKVYESMQETKTLGPGQIHNYLSASTREAPKIRFLGVFDTVKAVNDRCLYDISFNKSILHLRHALALNEDRKDFSPEYMFPEFNSNHLQKRSFVQAWFIGAHADMGGSTAKDGLSLYPLQWMLLESKSLGLALEFGGSFRNRVEIDNPLDVVFHSGNKASANSELETWSCVVQDHNGLKVEMQDMRQVHSSKKYHGCYQVYLNKRGGVLWSREAREPFTKIDARLELKGFCSYAPQGTIIHPSVYLLLDEYCHVLLDSKDIGYQTYIQEWRPHVLPSPRLEFWATGETVEIDNPTAIRILVCGNNGVGKSTLINEVFGVTVTSISHLDQGKHDINEEFTTPDRPDLKVHDSCGFETGDDGHIKSVKKFLKERSETTEVDERLHVIWLCFDVTDVRLKQKGTLELFNIISKYAINVPVVLVATKKDKYLDMKIGDARRNAKKTGGSKSYEVFEAFAEAQYIERMAEIEKEFSSIDGGRFDKLIGVSKEDSESIGVLTAETAHCFDHEKVRQLYISAQVTRIDLKIDLAVARTMQHYKRTVWGALGSGFAPLGPSIARVAVATDVCKLIVACFGVPTVTFDTVKNIVQAVIWDDLGNNISVMFAEGLNGAAIFAAAASGGILAPVLIGTGAINAPIVVPATTRLYLMLASDVILILALAFEISTKKCIGQPLKKDVEKAALIYKPRAPKVHHQIKKILPRTNMIKSFQQGKIKPQFEHVISESKKKCLGDIDAGGKFKAKKTEEGDDEYDSDWTLDGEEVQEKFEKLEM